MLGRTHSRLIRWLPGDATALAPDLALAWEQPEPLTWILRLDPRARWHDRPPVGGRALVANDVVSHVQRMLSLATGRLPLPQRSFDYSRIKRVVSSGRQTVTFHMSEPDAFLPNTLAGVFALIQAPEAVEAFQSTWHEAKAQSVVGTGPFMFDGQDGRGALRFKARALGHRVPLLDGLMIVPGGDASDEFLAKRVDRTLTRDRREAVRIRTDARDAIESVRYEDSPVISTLAVGSPPWNDARLRMAISGALNRPELARRLFAGRADPATATSPAHSGLALSSDVMRGLPGYAADPATDARDARQRWQAGGGPALGKVTIDFPSIFDPLYAASAVVTAMLNEVLGGDQFRAAVETYTTISAKTHAGKYGNGSAAFWFGWGPPISGPDPSRSLIETYHSASASARASGFASAALDRDLDALRAELSLPARTARAREIATELATDASGGVIHWLHQRSEVFTWPYLTAEPWTPFPTSDGGAGIALLRFDPSFTTRPVPDG